MRKSFLLYLFVFTALLAVIIFVNSTRILESKEKEIAELKEKLESTERAEDSLVSRTGSLELFTLASNEEALTYLEEQGLSLEEVAARLENEIISRNKAEADNNLVPYVGMEGYFRVNKIRILNHKWAIADFTDGSYWGEIFLSYYFDENKELEITTENALLYPKN